MADALEQGLTLYGGTAPAVDPLTEGMAAFALSKPDPFRKAEPKPAPGLWDTFTNGVAKGAAGFGDLLPNTAVNLANLAIAGYGMGKSVLTGSTDLPDLIPSDALSGWSKLGHAAGVIDDTKDPTTGLGRVVDFTGQVMGGGGINPRTLTANLASRQFLPVTRDLLTPTIGGVAGGLTQEGVRNIDPDTWYGRLANATLPAAAQFAGSVPTARASTAGERASQTTANVTPSQWQAATALAKKAADMGAPITAAEALQAVTGTNPGLQTLQRVTEQSSAGSRTLAPAFAQRPAQNRALFNTAADSIFQNEPAPDAIAGTLQRAAKGAIDAARLQGNIAAEPYYARSSNNPGVRIPSSDWNSLVTDPAIAWALDQTQRSPLLGVNSAGAGSVQWLDAAKKFLDAHADKEAAFGNNFTASQASKAATRITATIDPQVPDYAKARAIVGQNMQDVVEPMQASQVGKLADSSNFMSQAGALLPERPMDVTPGVISKTATAINAQDPTVLRRFLAQYLRGTFNEANQDLVSGANQSGGAKFAARVAGNDLQAANLQGLLGASGANPIGLLDSLDVWRAQGTRPTPGSATTFNNGETGLLSGGLLSTLAKPLSAPGALAEKAAYALSTNALSKALLPDGMTVERFQQLARANGAYSPMEQAKFAALLRATSSATPQAATAP